MLIRRAGELPIVPFLQGRSFSFFLLTRLQRMVYWLGSEGFRLCPPEA
jgi:hypothetical protein